jgi:glycosyltransferase involved in cell wall biosynthesis
VKADTLIPRQLNSDSLLSIVVPVFNEQEAIPLFLERCNAVFAGYDLVAIEYVFVNDGSTDATLTVLLACQQKDSRIRIVDFSRNFGKEAALTAGLHEAKGVMVVPIDVDLQHPPEIILAMIEKWKIGFDVVLGRHIDRDSDQWVKRVTALGFYRIHNWVSTPRLPKNVGDFRLMDRSVVDAINSLPESRRFMKGLFAWAGFRSSLVEYARPSREVGTTKFNGWRLWKFALEGITSFSTAPLTFWVYLGLLIAFLSFIQAFLIVARVLLYGIDVPGYASLLVTITFLGGVQIIGIGVLGEYIGRVYLESKRRPNYLVRKVYGKNDIIGK